MGRVWPRGAAGDSRKAARDRTSLPTNPGTFTRGFEIRAGVTVLIQDAEGVS